MKLKRYDRYIPTTENKRTLRVLLPDDYELSDKSYAVLYMHDGQNLFEDETAYGQTSWKVKDTMETLRQNNLIIVGIDNSDLRLSEYSPWLCVLDSERFKNTKIGGLGDVYAEWLVHDLKPWVDKTFRTKKEDSLIAGSSMGAYISVYIATLYSELFSHVGVFSLASWFNEEKFINHIASQQINHNQRYFISVGRNETSDETKKDFNELYIRNSRNLIKALHDKGVKDIMYIETDDIHNELAWRKRFVDFINYIAY